MYNDLVCGISKPLILLVGCLVLANSSLAQEELPFWRRKPKLYQKIMDQRKVVVSVDMEHQGRERKIRMTGVGIVNVPLYFALEHVEKFEDLPKVSGYFQKVTHKKEKKEVS